MYVNHVGIIKEEKQCWVQHWSRNTSTSMGNMEVVDRLQNV